MFLGDQTVGFVTVTDGAPDELGIPGKVRTQVNVSGCRFRPVSAAETVELTDVATELWRNTAPPKAAQLADATSELVYDGTGNPVQIFDGNGVPLHGPGGTTYQVIGGVKPYPDAFRADTLKVTIMCEKQVG